MKKLWIILLVAVMSSTMAAPVLAAKVKPSNVVTQGELARKLVTLLGLSRVLPANPSAFECSATLLYNGISPTGGWVVDKKVTRADLARVLVQAMGIEDQVKKKSDPQSWIDLLKAEGISIDTVGQATDNLTPLQNPVDKNVNFGATTDPLAKGLDTSAQRPDASSLGTDMALPVSGLGREEVLAVIAEVVVPRRPRVVTPN